MEEGNIIRLHSRDRTKNWLEYYEDKVYILHSELDHIRIGYAEGKNRRKIVFIDPPGGPFMSVGSVVEEANNSKIKTIKHIKGVGFAIRFV